MLVNPHVSMFHVQIGEGPLNTVAINPVHVVQIASPRHMSGAAVPPYNTVIDLVGGRQVCAVEPRDVVMSLNGKAGMDTFGNPGYFHAVPDPHEKDEWEIKRTDYPE